jgi:uncharacterized protein
MKWREMRRSDNVEDVRGARGRVGAPAAIGGIGLGGLLLALLASVLFGKPVGQVLDTMQNAGIGGQTAPDPASVDSAPIDDVDNQFVSKVLGDTEDVWGKIFQNQVGQAYPPPKLVLFNQGVNSACGQASTQAGPFYCPVDQKVYLDMAFFKHIRATAGDNADFARAYAISHEVGHHIQNTLGVLDQVRRAQQQTDEAGANALQVNVELQADCFAGVWGHHSAQRGLLDRADLEGALATAAQIGDDYLQKQARGYANPDSFTHGTSQQRQAWFVQGLKTGDIKQCDTFNQ